MSVWRYFYIVDIIIGGGKQIVKGIDAITREQLVRMMSLLGVQNATPIFSMVPTVGPFKPAALIPTITEEDQVILNNVQKVVEFLTAGSSLSRTSGQVNEEFYAENHLCTCVVGEVLF